MIPATTCDMQGELYYNSIALWRYEKSTTDVDFSLGRKPFLTYLG